MPRGPFAAGDVPNIQQAATGTRSNEGQTVLTNGKNVGGRAGLARPAPGALAAGAETLDVQAGPGPAPAARERGDDAVLPPSPDRQRGQRRSRSSASAARAACSTTPSSRAASIGRGFDTKYDDGRDPARPGRSRRRRRRDPGRSPSGRLTLWTQDFERTGRRASPNIPTVPVMHLNVTGPAAAPRTRSPTARRCLAVDSASPSRRSAPPTAILLDPATFVAAEARHCRARTSS